MYKDCIFTIILLFSLYKRTSGATVCTTRGRFPNNMHSDCRAYTMCLLGGDGFTNFELFCPENTVYSHQENQCTNVTGYECLPNYNCIQEGDFVNPSSENCTTYISCVKDLNNIITARLISCQQDEVYSTTETMCVNETLFKCNSKFESPKVLYVSVDRLQNFTGSFSFNSAACIRSFYITIIPFIALMVSK